jgi:RecA/RadA recombinase
MNKVMRIIKEKKLEIVTQDMEIHEETDYRLVKSKNAKKNAEMIFDIFNSIFEIDIKIKE